MRVLFTLEVVVILNKRKLFMLFDVNNFPNHDRTLYVHSNEHGQYHWNDPRRDMRVGLAQLSCPSSQPNVHGPLHRPVETSPVPVPTPSQDRTRRHPRTEGTIPRVGLSNVSGRHRRGEGLGYVLRWVFSYRHYWLRCTSDRPICDGPLVYDKRTGESPWPRVTPPLKRVLSVWGPTGDNQCRVRIETNQYKGTARRAGW